MNAITTTVHSIKIDPAFKSLIPPLAPEELAQLEANLIADGCRDPLVTWKGVLLDGHNRHDICTRCHIPFETVEMEFSDRAAAMLFMEENQVGRRNLSDDQRSVIVDSIRERRSKAAVARGMAKARSVKSGDTVSDTLTETAKPKTDTRASVAKEFNLPERKLRNIQTVKRSSPELVQKVRMGEIKLVDAMKVIRTKEIAEQRATIAKAGAEVAPSDRWCIHCGDMASWVTDKQFDFIITDPPYPKEFLPLYETLAERSNEWLKDGGLLIAMCGQSYLDQIYAMLSRHLTYYWTACYLLPGQPTPLRQVNVNTMWKPLLIFSKGKYQGKIFGDVFKSDGNDKEHHKWGQSVSGMSDIISKIALPGQSILDPFCGAGTTGVAALQHGCLFDGIELDAENVNISKERLAK